MNKINTLAAHHLCCKKQDQILFKNISFELTPGEILFVVGQNGAGKSSLLRLLAGFATPSDGSIFWQNKPISSAQTEYHEQLHYLGHLNGLKLGLTVKENLQLSRLLSLKPPLINFDDVLSLLQLNQQKNTLVKNLSAGQKRRVALAKLLLSPKQIWILDEPLTSLDTASQSVFLSSLENHLKEGRIAIISSHQIIDVKPFKTQTLRLTAC